MQNFYYLLAKLMLQDIAYYYSDDKRYLSTRWVIYVLTTTYYDVIKQLEAEGYIKLDRKENGNKSYFTSKVAKDKTWSCRIKYIEMDNRSQLITQLKTLAITKPMKKKLDNYLSGVTFVNYMQNVHEKNGGEIITVDNTNFYIEEMDENTTWTNSKGDVLDVFEIRRINRSIRNFNQNGTAVRDNFSGRIHSALTRLPNSANGLVKSRNGEVCYLDMKNCQPQLLLTKIYDSGHRDDDVLELLSAANGGRFYEELQNEYFLAEGIDMTRNEIKLGVMRILFSKIPTFREFAKWFAKRYPNVYKCIQEMKKPHHRECTRTLQQAEVKIFIDGSEELSADLGVSYLTKHDGLFIFKSQLAIWEQWFSRISRGKLSVEYFSHNTTPEETICEFYI